MDLPRDGTGGADSKASTRAVDFGLGGRLFRTPSFLLATEAVSKKCLLM